jgi:hypothetical protein
MRVPRECGGDFERERETKESVREGFVGEDPNMFSIVCISFSIAILNLCI